MEKGQSPKAGDLVVVVGAGRSGQAASLLLAKRGVRVRLLDAKEDALEGEAKERLLQAGVELLFGEHSQAQFMDADFVVPSPGMPLSKLLPIMGVASTRGLEASKPIILAETELAWRLLEDEKVITVTGTSGKTTTVSLIAAMLRQAGRKVFLGGNIGTPLSEYLLHEDKAEIVVLEVSSFQLQTCSHFAPDVAVLLNITPNHLDYHHDMREYVEAKMRLFAQQTSEQLAIVAPEWQETWQENGFAARLETFQLSDAFTRRKLLGKHNALNAQAAWQAVRPFGVDLACAQEAVATFQPLPHRLEWVCEAQGVLYINDSKCTTVSSLQTALEAMERPVLLLCGGRFKGGDLEALLPLVQEKVRFVAGFGESEEIFSKAWQGHVPLRWFATLKPAMTWLHSVATPGDVMLLAPATASFDLYKGMAYRGQDFKNIAAELTNSQV